MEEVVRKLNVELEALRKENEVLKVKHSPLGDDQGQRVETKAHNAGTRKTP